VSAPYNLHPSHSIIQHVTASHDTGAVFDVWQRQTKQDVFLEDTVNVWCTVLLVLCASVRVGVPLNTHIIEIIPRFRGKNIGMFMLYYIGNHVRSHVA
jgi:hypothetical protein